MRKKRIFCLGLMLSVLGGGVAAAPSTSEVGIIVGMNLSKLTGDVDVPWKTKGGVMAGFTLTLPLTSFFAIQPGLFYSQKGAQLKEEFTEGTVRTAMRLSYLDIPLVARLALPLGPDIGFRPYVLGGASYSLKLSATLRTDLIDYYETPLEEGKVEGLKGGGTNLVFGGGFDYLTRYGRFLFEARYSKSLQSISNEGIDLRLSVLSLIVGFSF